MNIRTFTVGLMFESARNVVQTSGAHSPVEEIALASYRLRCTHGVAIEGSLQQIITRSLPKIVT